MIRAQGLSAAAWSRYLTKALDNPVQVTYGTARRQVIQSRGYWRDPSGRPIEIRLSSFFAEAPPAVREALVTWIKATRRNARTEATRAANRTLDAFIEEGLRRTPAPPRKKTNESPVGHVHDLRPLVRGLVTGPLAEFRRRDFEPRGLPTIAWGRRGKSQAKRSLQLGSYHDDHNHIRIHTVLDQIAVPLFFVRFVLFHELLHATRSAEALRNPLFSGGYLHHDRAFREREAAYGDFALAQRWQERHIARLIRSARTGREFAPLLDLPLVRSRRTAAKTARRR